MTEHYREEKSWGHEEWIVNTELYCGKRLHFTEKFGKTSLHFHAKKDETMYVESGMFNVVLVNQNGSSTTINMNPGDSLRIWPLTPHRIVCVSPGVMVEFSTHHENEDSYRVVK